MTSSALVPAPNHLPIPTLWPPLPERRFQNGCKQAPSPTARGPGAEFSKPWWPFLPSTPTSRPLQPWHVFTGSYSVDVSLDAPQLDVSADSPGAPTAHIPAVLRLFLQQVWEDFSPARRGRFLEGRSICLSHTPTRLSLHADTHLEFGGLPTSSSPASCLVWMSFLFSFKETRSLKGRASALSPLSVVCG